MKSALVSSSPYEPASGLFLLAADVAPQQPWWAQISCFVQRIEQQLVTVELECMKKAPLGGFSRFTYLLA